MPVRGSNEHAVACDTDPYLTQPSSLGSRPVLCSSRLSFASLLHVSGRHIDARKHVAPRMPGIDCGLQVGDGGRPPVAGEVHQRPVVMDRAANAASRGRGQRPVQIGNWPQNNASRCSAECPG